MDTHKNASLTPRRREAMARSVVEGMVCQTRPRPVGSTRRQSRSPNGWRCAATARRITRGSLDRPHQQNPPNQGQRLEPPQPASGQEKRERRTKSRTIQKGLPPEAVRPLPILMYGILRRMTHP